MLYSSVANKDPTQLLTAVFDVLFKNRKPHKYYETRNTGDLDKSTRIIDRPEITLFHPRIDLDFTKQLNCFKNNLSLKPDESSRARDLHAIVKGVGSGKTSTLECLRVELNNKSNSILALPITNNNDWDLRMDFEPLLEDKQSLSGDSCSALCIASRIACMYYGMSIKEMNGAALLYMLKENGPMLPDHELGMSIIPAMIEHVVHKQNSLADVKIEHFVLLYDEAVRAEEIAIEYGVRDVADFVILSLLSHKYSSFGASLVISSLAAEPLGATLSGRLIKVLPLPECLNPKKVVEQWWLPSTKFTRGQALLQMTADMRNKNLEIMRLEKLAAVFQDLPLALELILLYLEENNPSEITAPLIVKIITKEMPRILMQRYGIGKIPNATILHNAIFNETMEVDKTVAELIQYSVLTNSIDVIYGNATSVNPRISWYILYANAHLGYEKRVVDAFQAGCTLADCASEFVRNYLNLFDELHHEDNYQEHTKGIVLELFVVYWLKARMLSKLLINENSMMYRDLLGISDSRDLYYRKSSELSEPILQDVELPEIFNQSVSLGLMGNSIPIVPNPRMHFKQFINTLNTMVLSETKSVIVFGSAVGSPFDAGMAFYSKGKVYVSFFDERATNVGSSNSPLDKSQYEYMYNLSKDKQSMPLTKNSVAEAIYGENTFQYIYLTTSKGNSYTLENCPALLVIQDKYAKRFLGPMFAFYELLRSDTST